MAEYILQIKVLGDGSGVIDLAGQIDAVADHANQAGQKISTGLSGINPAAEIVIGAFRQIGAVAINALGAAAGAVGGFLKDSVSIAGDFEAGMNTFQAAAGDSLAAAGLSADDFRQKFLQIGAELPVSTSAVQEAATTLIKGGLDPMVVSMGGLESSIKFAAAAGMDLNAAAELSIKQLGTFVPITASAAEQTQFLAESQDLLVKAAGASTLDVDKLGAAMLSAGGTAQAAGVDYEDFVTTMGMISPSFDSAATAGTSYKNFLTRLQPTTASAMSAMRDLNLVTADGKSKFFDSTGAFVGNREAAAMLQKSLAGLSDAQRTSTLQAIFGNDAMGAAVALANNGAAGYDKFAAAMLKASGVEATAKTVQQGFNIALDNMHGSVEALQIVVGSALLPVLTFFLNGVLSPGINLVTQFALAMTSGGDALAGLPPILQSVVGFFEALWNAEGALEAAFFSAGTQSLAFAVALEGLGAVLGLPVGMLSSLSFAIQDVASFIAANATPILVGLGVVLATVLTPIIVSATATFLSMVASFALAAAPLVALGVAAALLYAAWEQNFLGLQEIIQPVIDAVMVGFGEAGIGGAITGLITSLSAALPQLIAWFGQVATTIATSVLAWGQALVDWVAPYIPIAIDALTTWAAGIYTWITTQAPVLLQQFLTWGQSLIDWITPYAALAITTLGAWLAGIWAWVQEQAPGWVAQLAAWGQALADWVTPYISVVLTALGGLLTSAWAWVQEQAPGWLAQLGAWGTALAEWIGPAIPPALTALGELATSAFAWVGEQAAPLLASFSAWASSIVEWIPGAVVSFLAEWPGMLSSFLDWIASAAGPILARLGDWAISFINWVGPALPGILAAVGGIAAAILVFIAETVGVLLGKLAEWGPPFSAWVHEKAIPALQGQLANLGKSIVEWIGGAIKWLGDEAAKIGTSVVDGIKQGLSAGWGKVTSWLAEKVASIPAPIRAIMGIHSPSKVMADLVGVPIAQGIGAGFGQAFPKVEKNLINGIAGLSESAAKALDAGAKAISAAASYSGPGGSGLSGFLAAFADMAIQFNDAALMLGGRILGTATRFAETIGKVAGSIGPAVEGLEALQTFVAPSRSAMLAFTAAMSEILTLFKEVAYALTDSAIKYAAKFAESAGKILGVVEVGAKAIAALADLPTLAPGMTQTFANKVAWIVSRLAEVGAWMNGSALSNAATFAEGAGKVLAMVGTGVDAFAKLNTFVKPIDGVVQLFTNKVTWLMTRFAEVGAWMRGPILSAAVAFADGAATVLGVLETGVAGFAALNTFVRPLPGIAQAFTTAVYWLITRFVEAGAGLRAQGLAAATAFADASSKVTGMIGGAVDAFAKLREFVAPAQATVAAFGASLRAALATLIGVMKSFTAEAITAAGAFGEGAGKAVAFIGNASESLTKLKDFVAPTQAALASFGTSLRAALQTLIQVMQGFTADAIAAAGKFGEGAGKAVAFIGAAAEGFAKLKDFVAPSMGAIGSFGLALHATLIMLIGVMEGFAAEAIAAAGKFGEGAGKAVSFIGNAVGSFVKLGEFTGVGQSAIDAFGVGLRATLQALVVVAQSFAVDAVAAAAAFGEGAGKALAFIGNAVDGFTKLQDMGRIGQDHVNAFSYNIVIVVSQLRQLAKVFTVEALAAVGAFSDAVSKAVAGLGGAADSLGKLADVERLPVDAVNAWSYNVVIVIGQIRQLAKVFSTDALAAAAMFSASVSALVADVMTSMDAFATLGDAKRMGGDVLKSFMASAQSLVAQMNAYLPPSATIIGQNTVIGLINGIVSQRGALVTAMVNTVMAAVIAARQTLGIASPSKVFEQIGQYAGAGLQGGMAAMQPAIAATSAGLGISAVRATTSALRPSGGGTTNNNQRSVVIEAGAIVINGAGGNPRATADAVATELQRRIGMQGT